MELGDIWVKVARNQTLTPQEEEFLRLSGRNTQLQNVFISSIVNPDGTLKINLPIKTIYTTGILQDDAASIDVPVIPQEYEHLLIFSSGRTTNATGGIYQISFSFNRSSSDAAYQYIRSQSATLETVVDYTEAYTRGGYFAGDGNPSGENCSNVCFIPNYRTPLNKMVIALSSYVGASASEGAHTGLTTSTWRNSSPISDIVLSVGSGIKSGSIFSIYGIK